MSSSQTILRFVPSRSLYEGRALSPEQGHALTHVSDEGIMTDCGSLVVILAFWIHGKPTFPHTLPLLENLKDAPKAGTADDTEYRTDDGILDQQARDDEQNTGKCETPPALRAEIILALDYYRVEKTDYQKGDDSDDKTRVVHEHFLFSVSKGNILF